MYYNLSNIASVDEMKSLFDVTFKYPDIYLKRPLINGLNEELLPIITDKNIHEIDFGIWGILPEDYKEDWGVFQKTMNTLNLSLSDLDSSDRFSLNRRCIIIVTGFFLSYIYKGEIYPFYTYQKSKAPFALGGVYNTTYDGYITCSMLLTKISSKASKHHNIGKLMPLAISKTNYKSWLSSDYMDMINNNFDDYNELNFQSHPIAREFYKNEILFDSFLDPTDYESFAIPF